jgi:uncharacterized protein YpmB
MFQLCMVMGAETADVAVVADASVVIVGLNKAVVAVVILVGVADTEVATVQ